MGAVHLPLYAGLLFVGRVHSPQPGASTHLGLGMRGGSHSPSSSSSQSSGCLASAHKSRRSAQKICCPIVLVCMGNYVTSML